MDSAIYNDYTLLMTNSVANINQPTFNNTAYSTLSNNTAFKCTLSNDTYTFKCTISCMVT